MKIKALAKDFDHCRQTSLYNTFAEQLFAVHPLVKHLSMDDSYEIRDNVI